MYNSLKAAGLAAIAACAISACSDSTSNSGDQPVTVSSEMTTSVVTKSLKDGSAGIQSSGLTVDSLHVTRARFLISRLKLHLADKDTVTGDKEIKAGPFMVEWLPGQATVLATTNVPAGTYEHIKFEMHRFTDAEIAVYINDPVFAVFVTGQRYTGVIDGYVYVNASSTPVAFTYYSNATANLSLKFPSNVVVNSATTFALQLDPAIVFKKGSTVLDPRDPTNSNDIDNYIKAAIKSLKK